MVVGRTLPTAPIPCGSESLHVHRHGLPAHVAPCRVHLAHGHWRSEDCFGRCSHERRCPPPLKFPRPLVLILVFPLEFDPSLRPALPPQPPPRSGMSKSQVPCLPGDRGRENKRNITYCGRSCVTIKSIKALESKLPPFKRELSWQTILYLIIVPFHRQEVLAPAHFSSTYSGQPPGAPC